MKIAACLLSVVFFCGALEAYTPEESYRVAKCLVDRFKSSGEWVDCVAATGGTAEVDVDFPTAESLFAGEFPADVLALARTADDRRRAFDGFLSDLSQTNRLQVGREYERTGSYALLFCDEKGYAAGVVAATNILSRPQAPCRLEAHDVVRSRLRPSLPANALLETVLTNGAEFGDHRNASLLSGYARSLAQDDSVDAQVVSDGIDMLCRVATNAWAKMALDELMARRVPSYSSSSNRFAAALAALRDPGLSARHRAYFVSVTNEILSVSRH